MEAGAGGRTPERDEDAGDESAPEGEGAAEGAEGAQGPEPAADATVATEGVGDAAGGGEPPLKICRNCSVASRTDADACPSCGTPYERRRVGRPRRLLAWLAIPIIIAGFAIGYFGRKLIEGEDDPPGITTEQAEATQQGISRDELVESLGEEPVLEEPAGQAVCLYYPLEGDAETLWTFCFQDDALTESRQLAG
jgi:hypothetical protein